MPEVDPLDLTAKVEEILNRHAAVGLAVGVVRNGHLEFFHGHGVADITSNTPITGDTVFRIDLSRFGLGTARIVFSREPAAGTTRIHTDMFPLSLQKQPASQNPRYWITSALGAAAVTGIATAVRPGGRPGKRVQA